MKKRLALVLAGVMMVSSLAGCGSSKPAETTAAAAGETTAAAADAKADTTEAAKSDAAPELELIIASNQTSLDNPYSYGMDKFKEVVEDVSGGKIAVTVHKGTLGENENELIEKGDIPAAREIQYKADRIIYKMCEAHGNLYAVQKEILRRMYGLELGGVREPMPGLIPEDEAIVAEAQAMIEAAIAKL